MRKFFKKSIFILIFFSFVPLFSVFSDTSPINIAQRIRIEFFDTGINARIKNTSDSLSFYSGTLGMPDKFVLRINNSENELPPVIRLKNKFIKRVRIGQFQRTVTSVVFDLKKSNNDFDYTVFQKGKAIYIEIKWRFYEQYKNTFFYKMLYSDSLDYVEYAILFIAAVLAVMLFILILYTGFANANAAYRKRMITVFQGLINEAIVDNSFPDLLKNIQKRPIKQRILFAFVIADYLDKIKGTMRKQLSELVGNMGLDDYFAQKLKSRYWHDRSFYAFLVSRLRYKVFKKQVEQMLMDKTPMVVSSAIDGLSLFGDIEDASKIIKAYNVHLEINYEVVKTAIMRYGGSVSAKLYEIYVSKESAELNYIVKLLMLDVMCAFTQPQFTPLFAAALTKGTEYEYKAALIHFRAVPDKQYLDILLSELRQPRFGEYKPMIIRALAFFEEKEILPLFLEEVTSSDFYIRREAAFAIVRLEKIYPKEVRKAISAIDDRYAFDAITLAEKEMGIDVSS